MKSLHSKYLRILAISPSTRGFGSADLQGQETLVDWGAKSVKGDENAQCIKKVEEMINHCQPDVMVLQDHSTKDSRRCDRIQALSKGIIALASRSNMSVALFSYKQIRKVFFADGGGTKHALAEIIAKRFPEELDFRLPPKRRLWMSEDYRMNIFDAVALVLVFRLRKEKRTAYVAGVG